MKNKTENLCKEIFNYIFKYIIDNFDNTVLELKSFCTDFEDALISTFLNILKDINNEI